MRKLFEFLEQKPALGLLPLLLSPLIIWNCWNAAFLTLDDPMMFANSHLTLDAPWGDLFAQGHFDGYYFPLTMLSWKLDRLIGAPLLNGHFGIENELQAWASSIRVTNLGLHTLNGLLIWLIARRLGVSTLISAFVAAACTLHPISCESVCWAIERKNVLAAFFCWSAFYVYIGPFSWLRTCGATLLFGLALLSKPLALNLLPIVFLWEIFNRPRLHTVPEVTNWKLRAAVLAVWAGMAFWASLTFMSTHSRNVLPPPGGNIFTALLTDVVVTERYVWNLTVPTDLSSYYGITPVTGLSNGALWIGLIGAGGWLALMLYIPVQVHRKFALFVTGWFLCGWGTNWNLVGVNDLMHDRYIYLAIPGFWFALGLAAHGAVEKVRAREISAPIWARLTRHAQTIGLCTILLLAVLWAASSAVRGANFAQTFTLLQDAALKEPRSSYARCFFGHAQARRLGKGSPEEENRTLALAINHLEAGINAPDFDRYLRRPQAYATLATLYLSVRRFDLAEAAAVAAFNLPLGTYIYDSDMAMANFVLGRVCLDRKQFEEAVLQLQKALAKDPSMHAANFYLAEACIQLQQQQMAAGKQEDARKSYQKSREALLKIPAGNANYQDAQKILAVLVAPPD